MYNLALLDRIQSDPELFDGRPNIRGMDISVEQILALLADGLSFEAVLLNFPDLEEEDLEACLEYARVVGSQIP